MYMESGEIHLCYTALGMGNQLVCSFFDCFSAVFSDLADSSLELYVLIHNLDSQMLRGERSQQILAQLSSLPSIYLIASIDHINAPLSEFPWAWSVFCFGAAEHVSEAHVLLTMYYYYFVCITVDVWNRCVDVCIVLIGSVAVVNQNCVKILRNTTNHNIQIDSKLLAPFGFRNLLNWRLDN